MKFLGGFLIMEYSIAEKIAYVEEYRESGLSQSQFAKTKGIAP